MAGTHFKGPLSLERGAVTCTTNAATLHKASGIITSSTANLAAVTTESLTITNRLIKSANAQVYAVVSTPGTGGQVVVMAVTPSAGQFVINVRNVHATVAMTSAYAVSFIILNEG